jgi:hypothetical protein
VVEVVVGIVVDVVDVVVVGIVAEVVVVGIVIEVVVGIVVEVIVVGIVVEVVVVGIVVEVVADSEGAGFLEDPEDPEDLELVVVGPEDEVVVFVFVFVFGVVEEEEHEEQEEDDTHRRVVDLIVVDQLDGTWAVVVRLLRAKRSVAHDLSDLVVVYIEAKPVVGRTQDCSRLLPGYSSLSLFELREEKKKRRTR